MHLQNEIFTMWVGGCRWFLTLLIYIFTFDAVKLTHFKCLNRQNILTFTSKINLFHLNLRC